MSPFEIAPLSCRSCCPAATCPQRMCVWWWATRPGCRSSWRERLLAARGPWPGASCCAFMRLCSLKMGCLSCVLLTWPRLLFAQGCRGTAACVRYNHAACWERDICNLLCPAGSLPTFWTSSARCRPQPSPHMQQRSPHSQPRAVLAAPWEPCLPHSTARRQPCRPGSTRTACGASASGGLLLLLASCCCFQPSRNKLRVRLRCCIQLACEYSCRVDADPPCPSHLRLAAAMLRRCSTRNAVCLRLASAAACQLHPPDQTFVHRPCSSRPAALWAPSARPWPACRAACGRTLSGWRCECARPLA